MKKCYSNTHHGCEEATRATMEPIRLSLEEKLGNCKGCDVMALAHEIRIQDNAGKHVSLTWPGAYKACENKEFY